MKMRVVGLDVGSKKTGVAITNCEQTLIQPLETIHLQTFHGKTLFSQLQRILKPFLNEIEVVVLGWPKHLHSNQLNASIQYVNQCARMLRAWTSWTIVFQDETYSSVWAETMMQSLNYSSKQIHQQADAFAAMKILYDYFCTHNQKLLLSC